MAVERAINVGFHSYFGTLKRSRYSLERSSIALTIHSLDPTRLAIIDRFPFNPTYDSSQFAHYKHNLTDQATG